MQKILFLTQVLPYPTDAGPKMRAYYVLRQLALQHEIHLLSFVRSEDSPSALEHLKTFCKEVTVVEMKRSRTRDLRAMAASFLENRPFLIMRDRSSEMDRGIADLIGAHIFDAIHSDQLWMAPYGLLARAFAREKGENPLLVLDQHNAVFRIPERMAVDASNPLSRLLLRREAKIMQTYERLICGQFDRVVWVIAEDRDAVILPMPNIKSTTHTSETVIPICIDSSAVSITERLTDEPVILFVGGMHWPPNAEGVTWFAEQVLPLVRELVPQARLLAVGKSPPRQIQMLENVDTPGFVEDLEPYWQRGRIFIVPLRAGGGMRVKILDAWAHGLPVVSTKIGAEGIAYQDGYDILIADEPGELAQQISRMLLDKDYAIRLAQNGRQKAAQNYDWQQIYPAWEQVYKAGKKENFIEGDYE